MSGEADPLVWVAYAEEDYATARSAVRRKKPFLHSACFHAHQCAEKYLKALLISRQERFPKIHDLVELSGLCERAGLIVPVGDDPLDILSAHAVQARYPDVELTVDNSNEAIETAKAVRNFARKLLGLR